MRVGSDGDGHSSMPAHGHRCGLRKVGTESADLHVGDHSDTNQPPLGPRLPLEVAKLVIPREFEGPPQVALVVPAVVGVAPCRLVREFALGDVVLQPDLDGVQLEPPCDYVHCPLYQVGGFGPSGSPVCPDGGFVGKHGHCFCLERRDVVDSGGHPDCYVGHGEVPVAVGAPVADYPCLQAQNPAVLPDGCLDELLLPPPVGRRRQVLPPGLDPFDGPAELHCREADRRILWEDRSLLTEAAAHVGCDDSDLGLRQPQYASDVLSGLVRGLCGKPHSEES